MDPLLSQVVRDLRQVLSEPPATKLARKLTGHDQYPDTKDIPGHFVPSRLWKDGRIIADPAHDDR